MKTPNTGRAFGAAMVVDVEEALGGGAAARGRGFAGVVVDEVATVGGAGRGGDVVVVTGDGELFV